MPRVRLASLPNHPAIAAIEPIVLAMARAWVATNACGGQADHHLWKYERAVRHLWKYGKGDLDLWKYEKGVTHVWKYEKADQDLWK